MKEHAANVQLGEILSAETGEGESFHQEPVTAGFSSTFKTSL
jgi:hypothetical protein